MVSRILTYAILLCLLLLLIGEKTAAKSVAGLALSFLKWIFIIGLIIFVVAVIHSILSDRK